jgi:hypothetical protein
MLDACCKEEMRWSTEMVFPTSDDEGNEGNNEASEVPLRLPTSRVQVTIRLQSGYNGLHWDTKIEFPILEQKARKKHINNQ